MNFSLARQRFYHLIHQPESQINLAEAALSIAQEEYPDLEAEAYLNALDVMAEEVYEQLPAERYPLRLIQTINHYLYEDLGFRGNTTHYYDPKNSFLNCVIDQRRGIPITLSLVYLEIARRLEFPMVGIGMPGHFLIRPAQEGIEIYVDAFDQGEVLFPQDCQERLSQLYGTQVELRPEFLQPIGQRAFLARMLTNLKQIYLNQWDPPRALGTLDRLLLLFPEGTEELRDRGLLHYRLGNWTEARVDLQAYLEHDPTSEDQELIRQLLSRLQP